MNGINLRPNYVNRMSCEWMNLYILMFLSSYFYIQRDFRVKYLLFYLSFMNENFFFVSIRGNYLVLAALSIHTIYILSEINEHNSWKKISIPIVTAKKKLLKYLWKQSSQAVSQLWDPANSLKFQHYFIRLMSFLH